MRIHRWASRVAVLCAAAPLAIGTLAAPAVAAPTPGEPAAERISAGPYEGFQVCQEGRVLRVRSAGPTLAASPTPPPGSTLPPFAPFPGLTGTFELTRGDGQLVARQTTRVEGGRVFVFQVPSGRLPDGAYRWRVRAADGATVSPWTPWCAFTLSTSG